jgi:hypothetical protein
MVCPCVCFVHLWVSIETMCELCHNAFQVPVPKSPIAS